MRVTRRHFAATAASLLACAQFGCITTPDRSLLQSNVSKKEPTLLERLPLIGKKKKDGPTEPYPNPVKIAATWTPDTLIQTGRTPTRGFGGRVFFYDERSRPVPVEGTLTVHGFDDSAADLEERHEEIRVHPRAIHSPLWSNGSGRVLQCLDSLGCRWWRPEKDFARDVLSALRKGTPFKAFRRPCCCLARIPICKPAHDVAKFSPQYQEYLAATRSASTPTTGLTTTTIRRRQPDPAGMDPGITIPSRLPSSQLIAGQNGTRSFDLEMTKRPTRPVRPTILPASAELPLQR